MLIAQFWKLLPKLNLVSRTDLWAKAVIVTFYSIILSVQSKKWTHWLKLYITFFIIVQCKLLRIFMLFLHVTVFWLIIINRTEWKKDWGLFMKFSTFCFLTRIKCWLFYTCSMGRWIGAWGGGGWMVRSFEI